MPYLFEVGSFAWEVDALVSEVGPFVSEIGTCEWEVDILMLEADAFQWEIDAFMLQAGSFEREVAACSWEAAANRTVSVPGRGHQAPVRWRQWGQSRDATL